MTSRKRPAISRFASAARAGAPHRRRRQGVHAARGLGVHPPRAEHRAEGFFGEQGEIDNEVDRAVITVAGVLQTTRSGPRRADAVAESPASRLLRCINEPTSASAGLRTRQAARRLIAVYDLGRRPRSTSRSSASRTASSRCSPPTATPTLGGDDIDNLMIDRVLLGGAEQAPPLQTGAVGAELARPSAEAVQEIRKAAIQAKIDLSDRDD